MHTDVCPWSASFTQKIPRPIDNCKYGEYALVFYMHTLASYRTTYLKSQPFHFQFLVVKKRIRRSKQQCQYHYNKKRDEETRAAGRKIDSTVHNNQTSFFFFFWFQNRIVLHEHFINYSCQASKRELEISLKH